MQITCERVTAIAGLAIAVFELRTTASYDSVI